MINQLGVGIPMEVPAAIRRRHVMSKGRFLLLLACAGLSVAASGCDDPVGTSLSSRLENEIDEIVSDQMICDPGTNRCVGTRMEACAGVKWILAMECGAQGCDDATGMCKVPEGQDAPECYVTICDADQKTLNRCKSGKIETEACPEGSTCLGTSCIECVGADVRCRDGNVYECKENKWQVKETCSGGTVCDANSLTCKDAAEAAECVDGEKTCEGENGYKVCESGKWSSKSCNAGETCANGVCSEGDECVSGESVCDGDKLKSCLNGRWVVEPCEGGCFEGACGSSEPGKVCEADEKRCSDDGAAVLVCAKDGLSFEKSKDCSEAGENYVCDATHECVKAEDAKVCVGDQVKCSDDVEGFFRCVDGEWGTEISLCEGAQICVNGGCVDKICSAGDIKCAGKGYVKCIDNAWDDAVHECAQDEACVEKDGVSACQKVTQGVCEDGALQCDATDKAHKKYVSCVGGQWGTEVSSCDGDKICENGACVDPCINGDTKCADNVSLQTCSNGAWGDAAACPANETCSNGACVCKAGAKKCDGRNIVTCGSNGKWLTDNAEKCALGCDPTSEAPVCFECANNDVQCTGEGDFQICVDHKWQTFEHCGGKQCWGSKQNGAILACQCGSQNKPVTTCSGDNSAIVSCVTKTVEVNGAKFSYRGGWETTLTCDGGKCENGKNGPSCSCQGNETKCDGNSLYNCQNFTWTLVSECKDGLTCNAEMNACVCEEGTYNCTDNHTQQVCKNGKWIDSAECTRSQHCSNADGGACIYPSCTDSESAGYGNNTYLTSTVCLDPSTVLKCENRRYVMGSVCSKSQVCTTSSSMMNGNYAYCAKASGNSGTQCNMMQEGQTRCSTDGQSVEECKRSGYSYKWTATACGDGKVCVAKTSGYQSSASCEAKACDNYSYTCDKDKVMFCKDNALTAFADCASVGRACKDGQCVAK